MDSKLRIPSPLRRFTEGQSEIIVDGVNIKEVLDQLFKVYPDIKNHLIDDEGGLRNFVNIFINGEKANLKTDVSEGSDIRIIPSIAGG